MMETEFLISVIIPVYNRNAPLLRALSSVYKQTLKPLEVIVVDDGSEIDLQSVVESSFPQTKFIRQAHQGVSRARNAGVNAAKGDWIAFLDSDDEWFSEKLEAQTRSLSVSGLLLSHTNEIWIRNGIRVNSHNKHKKFGGDIFARALALCLISPSSVLMKKDYFLSLGGFDEELQVCEDYDLWLRICSSNFIDYIDNPLINKYGGHEDQLSRKYWGMDRFRIYAMEKLYNQAALNNEQKILLLKELSKKCQIYAKGARKHSKQAESDRYQTKASQYQIDLLNLMS